MFKNFFANEEGQGMVEYALIIALIAVALIVAFQTLKGKIDGVFTDVGTELDGAISD